jgi:hypothetical protein
MSPKMHSSDKIQGDKTLRDRSRVATKPRGLRRGPFPS